MPVAIVFLAPQLVQNVERAYRRAYAGRSPEKVGSMVVKFPVMISVSSFA